MRVKLGDRSLHHTIESDPAMANHIQDQILRACDQKGLQLRGIYTGMRGPDVWFEIADVAIPALTLFLAPRSDIGVISQQSDEKGTYLDVPMIFEKRQRRRRR